jgi:translation elongation factor EF-G
MVRHRHTARGLEAPVMGVLVRCPSIHVERVRRDLQRRGARIVAASSGRLYGVVRASVGIGTMLGYARQLHEPTHGTGRGVRWLERYEPVPEGGDAA